MPVHRIGFTRLGDKGAEDRQYRINIIFVHGLRGHPRETWEGDAAAGPSLESAVPSKRRGIRAIFRSKPSLPTDISGDGPPTKVFWPDDYLVDDLQDARVWTYGYNADTIGGVFEANNKNSVSQHGRDLSVRVEREVDNKDPIIFVAHSLGGIIVKDAIHRSEECQVRTKLIVFLGTPHRGSSLAGWGEIASNLARLALQDSNKRVIQTLEVNSEVLDNINEEFKTIVHAHNIRIHSFYESRGISGMKGLHNKVVDDFSSKLDLPRTIETVESIDANHMQMARCGSRDDAQYRAILGVLRRFAQSELQGGVQTGAQDTIKPVEQTKITRAEFSTESSTLAIASNGVASSCHHLPFRRNTRFVGREAELDILKDLLFNQRRPCVALRGLGGIGKTQIALELAYWAKEKHPDYSILWVPTLSEATFEQAYAEIARKLMIHKASDDEDVKESVRRHLSSEAAGPWLLILDNADDVDKVLGNSDVPGGFSQYLPESERGLVLYTTRSPDVAARATDEIELHEMSRQEAKSMLEKSLKRKNLMEDEAEVEELLEELTFLPLALAQAAAYLDRNRLTVADYLKLLRGTEEDMVSAMSREFHDRTRYPGSQNAVATTWLVSFDQIQKTDKTAAELLSFISQIEPKAIPQSILPKSTSEEEMVHAIGTLCGFAFLGRREEGDLFDMHSLVHVATRVWIERHELAGETEIAAVQHLKAVFPDADRANRTLWRHYLPHALRILQGGEKCSSEEREDLSLRVGSCLYWDRRFKEAIRCFEEVCEWSKEHYPEDNELRLVSEHALASAYLNNRRIKEAIKIFEHVVTIEKKTLAEGDPSRLASEHELARAYLEDRQIGKAIEILEHVVIVRKKTLVEDDHFRLASEHELARAYVEDRRVQEAIEILEHVVTVRKKTLAEEEHFRLASEHELARAYLEDRRLQEAIEILEHVVTVEKKTLAEEDPSRLASEHTLARAYFDNRHYQKAIEILEHVVKVNKRTLAEEDDDRQAPERLLVYALKRSRGEGVP